VLFRMWAVRCLIPLLVSIVNLVRIIPRFSKRYFTTQRIALPHIEPSLPSALNILIRAVARVLGKIKTRPSAPIPRLRLLNNIDNF